MKIPSVSLILLLSLFLCARGAADAPAPAPGCEGDGFIPLFDGKSLDGWTGALDSYVVEEGILKSLPDKGGNLITEKQYGDLIFCCEYRLTAGANNGIGLRMPRAGVRASTAGLEIQLLDDTAERHGRLKPYQFNGSVYGIVPAKTGFLKPLGEWNHIEVRLIGQHATVILNGEVIVDANLDEASTPQPLDERDHPGLRRSSGHVGLLAHRSEVDFRNVTLKALSAPTEGSADPSRVLFLTQSKGFTHGVVKRGEEGLAPAEVALVQLGEQSGLFRVDCTQDAEADFTRENLQNYDVVAFYTTGDLPIKEEDRDYFFNEWLKQEGHGVLGFHSAADTFHNYEPYWDMIGGTFISHPWSARHTVTLVNHEPENPIAAPFGERFTIQDEIYMYRNWQPGKVRVLLSLDYSESPTDAAVNTEHGYHVPIAWIKNYGDGRVYFNNLGHNETSWTNKAYLESITNAVKWMRGDLEVDARPNPKVSAAQEKKARKDFVEGNFKKKQ